MHRLIKPFSRPPAKTPRHSGLLSPQQLEKCLFCRGIARICTAVDRIGCANQQLCLSLRKRRRTARIEIAQAQSRQYRIGKFINPLARAEILMGTGNREPGTGNKESAGSLSLLPGSPVPGSRLPPSQVLLRPHTQHILCRQPLRHGRVRLVQQQHQIGSGRAGAGADRSPGGRYPRAAPCQRPAVSVRYTGRSRSRAGSRTQSRVVPGWSCTMLTARPVKALISVLLPAFGAPMSTTLGGSSSRRMPRRRFAASRSDSPGRGFSRISAANWLSPADHWLLIAASTRGLRASMTAVIISRPIAGLFHLGCAAAKAGGA